MATCLGTSKGRLSPIDIGGRILTIRGQRVLLDSDLAEVYGVPTHRLNEAVKRNSSRFPPDFSFVLAELDTAGLISQIAISKTGRGGRRNLPRVFTEHGAMMASTILNSPRAIEMSLYVVRAFVEMRTKNQGIEDAGFLLGHAASQRSVTCRCSAR